jgi:hypothetical protein
MFCCKHLYTIIYERYIYHNVLFLCRTMNTVSSMELNERGCLLLSQGNVSEGLEVFKKALSVLRKEINDRSRGQLLSVSARKPLYKQHVATAGTTGACLCWCIPFSKASEKEYELFWIFTRPLTMQMQANDSGRATWSKSDAFTISFNVALASHLQGVEQALDGDYNLASHSFVVAMKMYELTLSQAKNGAIFNTLNHHFNTLNDHLYAAIFSNLSHVHAMLGETSHSVAFAEQLLKTLFYLVDSGRVTTVQEATTHKLLLENAYCLLMAPSNSAAAA